VGEEVDEATANSEQDLQLKKSLGENNKNQQQEVRLEQLPLTILSQRRMDPRKKMVKSNFLPLGP
jgi:hypothetical protein